jgi:ACS family tartrate transporter-like MFS transporter
MSDSEAEAGVGRSALRKASWRLLPLIGLGYGIAYMDRVNISFAALQMNQDLHFSAAVYGLGGGLFFLSYALLEVPSNLLLMRFGARRWIARIMLTWGVLAAAMMFVRTPVQFYILRFLLGAAEAGFFPGVVFYLMQWFPAAHRGRAISRFYIAFPLSSVVMGALAGWLLSLQGVLQLAGWQWLFILEGAPAIMLSGVILVLLPDGPGDAAWLTTPERDWIATELKADKARLKLAQEPSFLSSLLDGRVLALGLANMCILGSGYAFTLSAPIILKAGVRLTTAQVGYLVAFAGLLGGLAMLLIGWHSDHRRERHLHVAAPLAVLAGSYAVIGIAPSPWVIAVAYIAVAVCNAAVQAVYISIPADALHGRQAAVGIAAIGTIGMLGSFVSPVLWGLARDATGSFQAGLLFLALAIGVATSIILILRHRFRASVADLAGAAAAAN